MTDKIPWLNNESFDPHQHFLTPLDASEAELANFSPDDDEEITVTHDHHKIDGNILY